MQAHSLKTAGLDYYNHNLDTSPEYYKEIISTRSYQDRLDTLDCVESAGISVCCGGIVNMGESLDDRYSLLCVLANRATPPESVPINLLIPIEGTPLSEQPPMDPIDFVRTIATARIMLPHSRIRLSAGRGSMSDEMQALCFFAGANSIHTGEKLLVTGLPGQDQDHQLLQRLGLNQHTSQKAEESTQHESIRTSA
jgi:biotin synthase